MNTISTKKMMNKRRPHISACVFILSRTAPRQWVIELFSKNKNGGTMGVQRAFPYLTKPDFKPFSLVQAGSAVANHEHFNHNVLYPFISPQKPVFTGFAGCPQNQVIVLYHPIISYKNENLGLRLGVRILETYPYE